MNIIEVNYKWNGNLTNRIETNFIVLHHAQSTNCTVGDIHRWHQENGWLGIGYQYFVTKQGLVYRGRPENAVGSHAQGYNNNSIGVCFEGDYTKETMPLAQMKAGIELVKYLIKKYPKTKVLRHKDINSTTCPGDKFPTQIILEGLTMEEQKHWAEDIFNELNNRGIKINEKRFDDNIKRGEAMALILQLLNKIESK